MIAQNRATAKALKLVIGKLLESNILTDAEALKAKRYIKEKRSGIDSYVPTASELNNTLDRLPKQKREIYEFLLFSGIRVSELAYILKHRSTLRKQDLGTFYKLELSYHRGHKKSFFCYVPVRLWQAINKAPSNTLTATKKYIQNHKLIPLKYTRKLFFTASIRCGCPAEIADFYQGRMAESIGGRHYLSRQELADSWYPKIQEQINALLNRKIFM